MKTSQTPQIYVGTYAKYNNGSIFGEWVDLEIYDTKDSLSCEITFNNNKRKACIGQPH